MESTAFSAAERPNGSHLFKIQDWLRRTGLHGLVIPSTDEFLSEFSPPPNRRLWWATGFRGSTGVAVVAQEAAALFLDSRYQLQGIEDVHGLPIEVKAATLDARREWLKGRLGRDSRLALDPKIHSAMDLSQWDSLTSDLGVHLHLVSDNPIDLLWSDARPPEHRPSIVEFPENYSGDTYAEKCSAVIEHIRSRGLEALLLADPEDVSWLLNARAADDTVKTSVGDWHVVPSCTSMVMVGADRMVSWFVDRDRLSSAITARGDDRIKIVPPSTLIDSLRDRARKGAIGVDPRRTPAVLITMIEKQGRWVLDDTTSRRRWRKHETEVNCARRAHVLDAVAVVRMMAWLTREVSQRTVTEFEAAQMLQTLRGTNPEYRGPSMPLMSASGASGAQPHYVPKRQGSRALNDHPLYWCDSGGHYLGGTTDNTFALAVGVPEPKHLLAHTLVLQGLIALSLTRFPSGIPAIRLDTIAREALWREGMDFGHSTGHGVGNYLNIHEGPLIGSEPGPLTTASIEPGMIVSNEPAYYAPGDFGVRVETHMLVVRSKFPGFCEFETISRLPMDPRLVDFDRLTTVERRWLADYHRQVRYDLAPMLDSESNQWLQSCVEQFVRAADAP